MQTLAPTRTVTGRVMLEPAFEDHATPPRCFLFLMLEDDVMQEVECVGLLAHDAMYVAEDSFVTVTLEDRAPFARARSIAPAGTLAA